MSGASEISSACTRIVSMRSSGRSAAASTASCACASASSAAARSAFAFTRDAANSRTAPIARKARNGIPGMSPIPRAAMAVMMSALRDWSSWRPAARPSSASAFSRVTIMPVDTAISSAGTWVTSPSPIVSRL